VSAGAKHKQSRAQRLERLASGNAAPSALAAGILHTCRRFLLGVEPANTLERTAFRRLSQITPEMREVLACAVSAVDDLPPGLRGELFDTSLLLDPSQPVTPPALVNAWTREMSDRVGDLVFGNPDGLAEERPGQIRLFVPEDDVFPSPVRICRLNGLRTDSFRPPLDAGDWLPDEVQQICSTQFVGETPQVICEVQTADCPGNSASGVCLRVPEVASGDSVVLEGVNFFSTDTIVRLTAVEPIDSERDVDTHVWGDLDTPVTETVDGQTNLVMDCRVHDRLTFEVPEDLPVGTYQVRVVVPNISGVEFWGESLSSASEYITVIPPPTARFEIFSEQLYAEEETSPAWAGSDEVALKFLAVPIHPDLSLGGPQSIPTIRLGNVDSDDLRDITRKLFSHQEPIAALAMMALGHEVDSEAAYEQLITEFSEVFIDLVSDQITWVAGALSAAGVGAAQLGKVPTWGWIAIGVAIGVTLAVDAIIALWAPADPIIDDVIAMTVVDLAQLTSPDFPMLGRQRYTRAHGIKVLREPVEKLPTQYKERRTYESPDEGSTYQLRLRFNRVV
jgi:hypothetical protein